VAAVAEGWQLADVGPDRKELVLGNEAWPFPVPLVKGATGWSFDAAAGREELLNRRIGRNELAVIRILQNYVAAQRAYAAIGHDGKPAGLFARRFGSEPGKQNGLYWPAGRGEPRSPLGVLTAQASEELQAARRRRAVPVPRLLLPHPRGPGQSRERRRCRVRRERRDVRRLRARRLAGALRLLRRDDVHRQPRRRRVREGPRVRDGRAREGDHSFDPDESWRPVQTDSP
jgi:hypothetical protein